MPFKILTFGGGGGLLHGYSVVRNVFLDYLSTVVSHKLDVEMDLSFSVVDTFKVGVLCCWFRWCRLVSRRHGVRLLNQISQVFTTSGRMKESSFWLRRLLKSGRISPLHVIPTFCQGLLGISALELFYFIYFTFIFLITHTQHSSNSRTGSSLSNAVKCPI